jgi:hypothetical protein
MADKLKQPIDGDAQFGLGMFSSEKPNSIPLGSYYRAFNAVLRGSKLQCRPGYKFRLNLPDGKLQGLFLFEPTTGVEQLVIVVAGKVYVSNAPFDEYYQIPELQFYEFADQVWFAQCERAVQRNEDFSLTLIDPKAVLMIQDGVSAPASWDGAVGQHHRGFYATPQGTAMAWSGGRLWVARNRSLFASDYADPFSFFEGQYIGDTNSFQLPGNIRALKEVPDVQTPRLLAFTADQTVGFVSGLRARDLWTQTAGFQQTILPDVGCSSQRSIVAAEGLLYWFSAHGLTRLDVAQMGYVRGRRAIIDTEMAVSKYRLDPDTSLVAGCAFESYLLMSVPHAAKQNTHTWCLDNSGQDLRWCSYWTGTRPVEWASGTVNNESRCFYISKDYDGYNRLWEAFSTERTDNGCPISWGFETRCYRGPNTNPKIWRNAEVKLTDIIGDVDIAISFAGGLRGRYKRIGSKRISAAEGTVGLKEDIDWDEDVYALRSQTRTVRSVDDRLNRSDDLSSCCLDSDLDREEHIDTEYQLCVLLNGSASVEIIRVWMDIETEQDTGQCATDEDDGSIRAERFDGGAACGTVDAVKDKLDVSSPVYAASATVVETYNGVTETGAYSVTTSISQKTADKMADCSAAMRAAHSIKLNAPGKLGGFLVTCLPSN